MKKITLMLFSLVLTFTCLNAQTFSTGLVELSNATGSEYSIQIDVTSTEVTLTMIGPAGKWLGLGFGNPNTTGGFQAGMVSGNDVVIFRLDDSSQDEFTDRYFGFPGQMEGQSAQGIVPSIDEREDWTIETNDVNSGVRTLVATRDLDTGNPGDYVFSTSDTNIDLVWASARDIDGDGTDYLLDWHGPEHRGILTAGITLSQSEVQFNEFRISPNPSKNYLNITLPLITEKVIVEVFDVLGKKLLSQELTELRSSINVSKWNSGVYLVKVSTDSATLTKRFIKQ
ncbi:T9SS type A sorting domain-containing protein [Ichthyenterobacterium sp. W332]|uniref:T9SS type A sorting domain-containing protein n=1 Tax=Microcosmobacter mediterraneus TaxID=3075607 RepID=A0ABU2YJ35_9FLAO|nr:T9SS type A sorting domain-containing protein [Ichthyenterobacterium sp. W332]MDT0557245.1 T9SS type A sorting domain-containing protein [Ichthyenterobacterium sp. W332]